ncbi:MAG: hypothetical protein V8S37_06960 [Lachnospiraceae bacterium]
MKTVKLLFFSVVSHWHFALQPLRVKRKYQQQKILLMMLCMTIQEI